MHYEIFRNIFVYENYGTMSIKNQMQPTESELQILQVLWDKGYSTVREVYEVLKEWRNTGYTTTLKTMQIMTEKGLVRRDTSSRI